MFFSKDVLFATHGKFAVVWLLGNTTSRNKTNKVSAKISKSDIIKTDIRRICREIAVLLPVANRAHISLRMATTLYLGSVTCHARQVSFLLADLRGFRVRSKKRLDKKGTIDCDVIGDDYDEEAGEVDAEDNPDEAVAIRGRRRRGTKRRRVDARNAVTMPEQDLNQVVEGMEPGRFSVNPDTITLKEVYMGDEVGALEMAEDDGFGVVRGHVGDVEAILGPMDEEMMPPPPPLPPADEEEVIQEVQETGRQGSDIQEDLDSNLQDLPSKNYCIYFKNIC